MGESSIKRETEAIFFKAMRAGYAARVAPQLELGELRNEKVFTFTEGSWVVKDRWIKGEGGLSAGWTLILYCSNPVWHMQYWGQYENEAIPLLKTALRKNYENNLFVGGRGPNMFSAEAEFPELGYMNAVQRDTFSRFSGVEGIIKFEKSKLPGRTLGRHEYQGGYLLNAGD